VYLNERYIARHLYSQVTQVQEKVKTVAKKNNNLTSKLRLNSG
jgi:hypothetical protein